MKILLWHGYLMSGSGSNVYTTNVSAAWRRQGHDVLVMCQEREPERFDSVDRFGSVAPRDASIAWTQVDGDRVSTGRCSVVRPDIGELLPVYVYDDYPGFQVKLFVDLSEAELRTYTERNVDAMETVLNRFRPDAVITGHEVMGPSIARAACARTGHAYVAKLHGSALEYAVKRQQRYVEHATEGLGAARKVVGGSRYMLDEAASVIPGWRHKAAVVNPGADVDLFRPMLRPRGSVPTIGFVGKLIVEKGAHNLLAALAMTSARDTRAVIVGYGGDEDAIRSLHAALAAGDLPRARAVAAALRRSEDLMRFVDRAGPAELERYRRTDVEFTGRLEHGPLAKVLPTFDVLVVPSIVPEAFGMVAAEAAACGVLPVVPDHSGIVEAGRAVEEGIGLPGFLTYDPADPIAGIAAAIDRVLGLDPEERARLGLKAADVARDRWSWERVADRLLEAAVALPG